MICISTDSSNLCHYICSLCYTLQVPKKLPKVPPKDVEITLEEKVKLNWLKEVKSLNNNICKDSNLFLNMKFKGGKLLGDMQSGVTKELISAIENGLRQLQSQGENLSEILVLGTSEPCQTFNPQNYANKVDQAKQVQQSLLELKSRVVRIIGK